ncbi:MAG: substrate-binding domain-containing protein [Chloroflexi bacterium]|nr:substrate-binding domain-containing protein [Chloroflexota bacterium]
MGNKIKKKEGLNRREFMLSSMLLGAGIAAPTVLSLLEHRRVSAQDRPLRAAMSNAGLAVTWCAQGKDTAEMWGEFLGVEIVWFDGQLDTNIQRAAVDQIATQEWDFVAIQPNSIGSLIEPIQAMTSAGIPFVGMDTLIAPLAQLDDLGVLTFIAPDNVFMSEGVVNELVSQMGGEGKIAHTWGQQGHTGAQGRAQGFYNIMAQYPNIEVVDDQFGDWDVTRVASIWESILNAHPDIRAGFLHNDDMALAARQVVENAGLGDQVLIGGIDAMSPAIDAVTNGRLVATARNSAVRVHGNSVVAGWVAANVGLDEARNQIPSFMLADGPVVTASIDSNPDLADEPWKLRGYGRDTSEGLRWLQDQLIF